MLNSKWVFDIILVEEDFPKILTNVPIGLRKRQSKEMLCLNSFMASASSMVKEFHKALKRLSIGLGNLRSKDILQPNSF